MNISEKFESFSDDYLKFDLVNNRYSNRPDLHALILLDKKFPDNEDLITAAEHDIIFLNISEYDLNLLSDDEILTLVRCGFTYDSEYNCLSSFV